MTGPAHAFIAAVNWVALAYFLCLNLFYLALLLLSGAELRAYLRRLSYGDYDLMLQDPHSPAVSVLMPAHNEAVNIVVSVRGVLNLNYPAFQVIVVNDGSTDGTLEALRSAFSLVATERVIATTLPTRPIRAVYRSLTVPGLTVIDKENGGKADALNAGINASRMPYVCSVDADIILEEDALLRVMRPVVDDPARVVAVGGIVRVANGCRLKNARVDRALLPRAPLPMFQVVEYLRAFLGGRTGFSSLNGLLIISGAFGVFSKKWALAAGGYRTDTVGEDMELVLSMHRLLREMKVDYRVVFVADPVCWTEVPSSVGVLGRQRRRWQRGLMEALRLHRTMLFNPRYGLLGWVSYPFFYFFEGWGPLVEALGFASVLISWRLGWTDSAFAVAFLTLSVILGMIISLCAVLLEEFSFHKYSRWSDLARLASYALIENVGYRQMNTVFRCLGLWDFLRRRKGWGEMTRVGLGTAASCLLLAVAAFAGPAEDGRAALGAGRGEEAAVFLRAAVEARPGDLDLRADLGRALAWSGRYEEAEREYRVVLSSRPDHREALLGTIRLDGYRGRLQEALAGTAHGLALHPGDREFEEERLRLSGLLRRSFCSPDKRFTVRCGYGNEHYSFARGGNGLSVALRDRRLRGWDAGASASYERRFGLDDLDLGASLARRIRAGWAGVSLGGATRHALLPVFRAAAEGGAPLGAGFGAEAKIGWRLFDDAKVYSFSPSLTWEGRGLALSAGYDLSATVFDGGARSGGLSSFRARAAWLASCPVIPWVAYARTREAFEAGSGLGARAFSADHYSAGATVHLPRGFALDAHGEREERSDAGRSAVRFGLGAAYSWGALP